jgi:tetratricopeptide (TPR) repeat protein
MRALISKGRGPRRRKMRVVRKFGHNVNGFHKSWSYSESVSSRFLRGAFSIILALISVGPAAVVAQQTRPQKETGVTIQGNVLNSAGKAIGDASVQLEQESTLKHLETKTNAAGVFAFTDLSSGRYLLSAEKSGQKSHNIVVLASPQGDRKNVDLILEYSVDARSDSRGTSTSPNQAMEFSDKPNFTIAGVTDWTAVGGHGSDSALRTSEDLARETLTLKPDGLNHVNPEATGGGAREEKETENKLRAALAEAPGSFERNHQLGEFYLHAGRYQDSIPFLRVAYEIDPSMDDNAYDLALAYKGAGDFSQAREYVQKLRTRKDSADLHRLAGQLDEKLGDPLAAVQEEEQAVRLDPTEQNYFEWGSELLLHRAVWQATEVFKKGARLYPKSPRMLTALGASLFTSALYDEAALRLCEASDLDPTDPEPYSFMGKVEREAPSPLPCVEQRLARVLQMQPDNALANYLYAMAVSKRQELRADPVALQKVETLLTKAVKIDRNFVDAYLQLGILYSSQHKYEKAIDLYKKAIEIDPQLGEAHYRLGVAYDRTGEPAKGKKEFALHDEIEKQKAAVVERQRREIKQFLIVLEAQPTHPTAQ